MRLHYSLPAAALVALVLGMSASAQITITEDDIQSFYDGPGSTTSFDADDTGANLDALQALAEQTGPGQTWDFTGLTYTNIGTFSFAPVEPPVPGSDDPHLAQANLIVQTSSGGFTSFSYHILDADEFTSLGVASDDPKTGVTTLSFIPGNTQPLPYTFGSSWTNDYETVFDPPFPIETEITTHEESEVIGWGTLITPAGSASALMVESIDVITTTVNIPPKPTTTVDTSRTLTFHTEGGLSAYIALEPSDGTAFDGGYSTTTGSVAVEPGAEDAGALRLEAIPNPVTRGPAQIRLVLPETGHTTVRVYDTLGRQVAALADRAFGAGEQTLVWDASALPSGLYVVRVEAGGTTASCRITIAR